MKENLTLADFTVGMQVQVDLRGVPSRWGNDRDEGRTGVVEQIDHFWPSISVRFTNRESSWFLPTELKILSQESQEHRQPKTQQSTQEFTFTLDDLAKACDTSGIGSQKFLELQRALTNLK